MVDNSDRRGRCSLQRADVPEKFSHGSRLVLVKGVESNERIEHEQSGAMKLNCSSELLTIGRAIQSQGICAYDANIDLIEIQAMMPRQRLQSQAQS